MDAIWSFLAEYKLYILLAITILAWQFIDKIQFFLFGPVTIYRKVD